MANEKLHLEICCGTTCYMLGAVEILDLESKLPEQWKEYLEISARPCLDACTRKDLGEAPFVRFNGELIGNATPEKIYKMLETAIEQKIQETK